MKLKEYELNVKNMDSSSGKLIKCLCVPKICPNIKGQSVKQELKKRDFIKALKLADTSISPECSIDVLIGSDIYWDFVTRETKHSLRENLVAVNAIFGWLISGPVECSKQEIDKTVTLTATQMLKIGCYAANDERGLKENISKFWDLDAVGIKDNEISIYEKFKDDIKFENNSYSVKLPVKEFHPILPDNYLLSLKRSNTLKGRLDGNRELLKHYDDSFQEQLQAGIIEEVYDEGEGGNVT